MVLVERQPRAPARARWPSKQRQLRHIHHRAHPLPRRHADRLRGRAVAPGGEHDAPERVGARRARLWHLRRLVPDRGRPLYRVHKHMFPSWFTGIAFSAIVIGALVPAAIMAIAAANLFTRNIFKEFFKPDASPSLETRISQWGSLIVNLRPLLFSVYLPPTFSTTLP